MSLTIPVALRYARIAGLLYLIIIVCGISSELFVRTALVVPDDAAATAANILAAPGLFRAGFGLDSLMLFSDVAVALLLYFLLASVSRPLAATAAAFRLIQAAVLAANLLLYYGAIMVLEGSGFETASRHDLAALLLQMHTHGYDLGLLFFAFSNFILGYLVVRSGYFPTLLGYGLGAAALVYLVGSFIRFLIPGMTAMVEPLYFIPFVAELAFALWLVIKGVRTE
jgi:hypothetical protein